MKCCPKEGQEHSRRAGTHPQHSPMAMPPAQPHPAPSCQCRRVLPPPKPCAPLELLFGRKGGFLELGLDICRAWIFPLKIPIPAAEQPLKHFERFQWEGNVVPQNRNIRLPPTQECTKAFIHYHSFTVFSFPMPK